MLTLTNKYKLYLYVFFFVFLSSIFNLQFLENYQDKFRIKKININGLSINEKQKIENELVNLKNRNIFKLNKEKILENLNKFNYLENIYVNKVMPSSIILDISKTSILGKTSRNGELFYIGKNRKLINSNQISELNDISSVFGDFKISEYLNLLTILKKHQLDLKKIESFFYFKNKRWDILFTNGVTLMLPSKTLEESLIIYKKLLINEKLTNVKIIDLRISNQIILTN